MVTLSDNSVLEMQWKQVVYEKGNICLTYEIIPMLNEPDVLVFTDSVTWQTLHGGVLSEQDRQDILNKITSVKWKRDLVVKEVATGHKIGEGLALTEGMIEMTPGYKQLCGMGLFDPEQQLTNDQVKQIYIKAETKYCEAIRGVVTIPQGARIKGSIVEEICVPAIKNNPQAVLPELGVRKSENTKKAFIKTIKSGLFKKKTLYEVRFQDEAAFRDNGMQKFNTLEECHAYIAKVRNLGYNVSSEVVIEE